MQGESTNYNEAEADCVYSNFIGGWMGFWQSPEVLAMNKYLLWEHAHIAFLNRWGDQPVWSRGLKHFAPPPWRQRMLALEPFRKRYFVHTKEPCRDKDLGGYDIPCPT